MILKKLRSLGQKLTLVGIDNHYNSSFRELFLKPWIYSIFATLFYLIFRKKVKLYEGLDSDLKKGLDWNMAKRSRSDQFRPAKCFRIARAHDLDLPNCKLLVIGPRNFSELLLAWFNGFKWKNIYGFDLYSEFHKVRLGNLERTPTDWENKFDVIVCSGVLNYCKEIQSCMSNLVAMTKPGGLVIIQQDENEAMFNSDKIRWSSFKSSGKISISDKAKLVEEHIEMITFLDELPNMADPGGKHHYLSFKLKE